MPSTNASSRHLRRLFALRTARMPAFSDSDTVLIATWPLALDCVHALQTFHAAASSGILQKVFEPSTEERRRCGYETE